jgi:hypothetical protein
MITLLTDQRESDRLYDRWAAALVGGSDVVDRGWLIAGTGIMFTNYGDARPGKIRNAVMLGLDTKLGRGVVKIVRPDVAQQDKGKLTAIGRDSAGRLLLLRQGRLQKNPISRAVREDFGRLTGLTPVTTTPGCRTPRDWYLVADLSSDEEAILRQTADFANACARAHQERAEELSRARLRKTAIASALTRRGGPRR